MKISVITLSLNSEKTIKKSIKSIIDQTYNNIEHIIIDGNSNDKTINIIKKFKKENIKIFFNKKKGIYNSLNLGIEKSTGDLITILNSDDIYNDNSYISNVISKFKTSQIDYLFSDVNYFDHNINDITRYYKSPNNPKKMIKYGIIPAHTSLVIKKEVLNYVGMYNENFKIAGDFEFFLRLFNIKELNFTKIEGIYVYMKSGGVSNSSIFSRILTHREILRAFKINNIPFSHILLFYRYILKLREFFKIVN